MYSKEMKVKKINRFLICFILLVVFCTNTDVAFETLTVTVPGTVYPYTLNSG